MSAPCQCGHSQALHLRDTGDCVWRNAAHDRCVCPAHTPDEDLTARLVRAIVEELREDDQFLLIGIGERELRITWGRDESVRGAGNEMNSTK